MLDVLSYSISSEVIVRKISYCTIYIFPALTILQADLYLHVHRVASMPSLGEQTSTFICTDLPEYTQRLQSTIRFVNNTDQQSLNGFDVCQSQ